MSISNIKWPPSNRSSKTTKKPAEYRERRGALSPSVDFRGTVLRSGRDVTDREDATGLIKEIKGAREK